MELILNKEIIYTTDFGNIYGKIFFNGPIILFLHGWLHSSEIWSKLFKIIPKKFKLIALDLPGFGKSNPINHFKITIQTYSIILQQIVDEIKKNEKLYAIFGDSISGLLILNLLTRGELCNTKILISGCPIDGLPSYLNIFQINGLVTNILPPLTGRQRFCKLGSEKGGRNCQTQNLRTEPVGQRIARRKWC